MRWGAWALLLVLAACSGSSATPAPDGAAPGPDARSPDAEAAFAAELEPVPLGLPSVESFSYATGPGQKHLRKALAARDRGDWRAVRAACEEAIVADPAHLEAHRLLASALASLGEERGVARHLHIAVAGDTMRYGTGWEKDPALAAYLAGPRGARVRERLAAVRAEFATRAQRGLLVVARRAAVPALRAGAQDVLLRAEIYAWDAESARFLRVSRTNGNVLAFLRAPGGDRLAYVAFSRARGEAAGKPAALLDPRIGAVDLAAPAMSPRTVRFQDAVGLRVEWDADGRLLAVAGDPDDPRLRPLLVDVGAGRTRDPGKLVAVPRRLRVRATDAELEELAPEAVEADWDDGVAGAFRLSTTNKTVTLPTSEHARRASVVWSPGRARLAFATRAEPCGDDAEARKVELYVVDAASGRLRLIARGEGLGAMAWIDDDRVAYEDGAGGVRVVGLGGAGGEIVDVAALGAPGGMGLGRVPGDARCAPSADPNEPE
jgi:hypothetical protein